MKLMNLSNIYHYEGNQNFSSVTLLLTWYAGSIRALDSRAIPLSFEREKKGQQFLKKRRLCSERRD